MNRSSGTRQGYMLAITTLFNVLRYFDVRCGKRSPVAFVLSSLLAVSGCDDSAQSPEVSALPADTETPHQREVPNASSQLDSLIKRYADAQIDDDQNTGLQDVSADAFLREIESNRRLLQQVTSVDPGQLLIEERIDRRLLIGLLESDTYSAEHRRMWEKDASMYVPAGQIGRLLEPEATESPAERAKSLLTLLQEIPHHIDIAKQNLRNPPRRFTEAAIFKTQGTIKSLKTDAPTLATQAAVSVEDFTSTLDAAVAALESFEQFLQNDLLPESDGSWAIGKEHYDYILQHRWFF